MKDLFKGLFSIDERRISTIIVVFFVFVGVALYKYFTTDNITQGIQSIIINMIYIIGGVNVSSNVLSAMNGNNNNYCNSNYNMSNTNLIGENGSI